MSKLSKEQRQKIIALLREHLDKDAIAREVGVTRGQVSAVAAHLTMRTYTESSLDSNSATTPPDVSSTRRQRKSHGTSKGIAVLIGTETQTGDAIYWCPTPDSGTPNPHLLIIGESGSGKTYATQCVCTELTQQALPTLIFDFGQGFSSEVVSSEFKRYARPTEINVGRDGININPLQIFPADIHGPVNVAQRIADTFARIYPNMGVQQHALLRDAILRTFEDAGIDPRSKKTWSRPLPRFNDLRMTLETMSEDKQYVNRRLASALTSHISSVFVFNTFRATGLDLDWARVLGSGGQTYIVQLKGLENLLENIVTELLLWNLIGFIESLGPGDLRCIVMLDEAHRLSFVASSPVEKLLREGRKFGIGVLLASQQPEDFSPVAFTNTATKLIFNVTDERGAVARQIARKAPRNSTFIELLRQLGRLPRGSACFLTQDVAAIVRVTDMKARMNRWAAGSEG